MLIKLLHILILTLALTECAKLRKTPKVYNALITTDENLTPSKAYPIIQPVIQPAIPVLSPIYPVYSQYLSNDHQNENQQAERKVDDIEVTNNGNSENNENHQPGTEKPNTEKLPIELNEFGLPPSLIPLQKFPSYPYNLPFYVDSYGNYQTLQYPVLPPINFYNPDQDQHQLPPIEDSMFEVRPDNGRSAKSPKEEQTTPKPNQPSDDAFKNNANKNSEIPDIIPDLPYHIKKN